MLKNYASYIKESIENFKVGDTVTCDSNPKFGLGKIVKDEGPSQFKIDGNIYIVEFENPTTLFDRPPAKERYGWRSRASGLTLVKSDEPEKFKIRWYRHGKLEESIKDEIEVEVGDIVKHPNYPQFGLGVVMSSVGVVGNIIIEFEHPTGVKVDRKPARHGYGWLTSKHDVILVKKSKGTKETEPKREPRIRWYRHGKLEEAVDEDEETSNPQ